MGVGRGRQAKPCIAYREEAEEGRGTGQNGRGGGGKGCLLPGGCSGPFPGRPTVQGESEKRRASLTLPARGRQPGPVEEEEAQRPVLGWGEGPEQSAVEEHWEAQSLFSCRRDRHTHPACNWASNTPPGLFSPLLSRGTEPRAGQGRGGATCTPENGGRGEQRGALPKGREGSVLLRPEKGGRWTGQWSGGGGGRPAPGLQDPGQEYKNKLSRR